MPFDGIPDQGGHGGQERFDFARHFHYGRGLDNLDGAENIFFQRELEHIIPEMFEFEFARINARRIFPIDRSAGQGIKSITWRQFTKTGNAQIVADYADDIPIVNVQGEEFTTAVRGLAVASQWSIDEIRAAQRWNRPLERMFVEAARETMLREENSFAFNGSVAFGIQGLFSAGTGIPNNAAPTGAWTSATGPLLILADLNFMANTIPETTGDVEAPTRLLLPTTAYNLIASTNVATGTDTTILRYFLNNNPYINEVLPVRELESVTINGVGPGRVGIAYEPNPSKLRLQVPMDIEQFAPQQWNMVVRVLYHMKIAGLTIFKPGSIHVVTGV